MSNRTINLDDFDDELLDGIEQVRKDKGFESIEQTITAMVIERANIGVGATTGGADLRSQLSVLKKRNTKRYGADYE